MRQRDIMNFLPAYHEAGHAVAAYVYTIPLYEINIHETEDRRGRAFINNTLRIQFMNDRQFLQYIKSIYAGNAAEMIYAGKNCKMTSSFECKIFNCAYSDIMKADELIKSRFPENAVNVGILRNETTTLLIDIWKMVELLANTLQEEKEMTFQDISELLGDYMEEYDHLIYEKHEHTLALCR